MPHGVEGAGRRLLDVLNALQNVALWKTMTIHNVLPKLRQTCSYGTGGLSAGQAGAGL